MHPTVAAQATLTPTKTLVSTEVGCQEIQGHIIESEMQPNRFDAPLAFTLYLPPCYEDVVPSEGYPLLILLHGQTYTSAQWIDIGLPEKMDQLINSGDNYSFAVVMPYESADYSVGFHTAIIEGLVPYLQENYALCQGRECLAVGGISRGGGWALTAAFKNPDMFSSLGLHSTPVSEGHLEMVRYGASAFGTENLPRIYLDYGVQDYWYASEKDLADTFDQSGVAYTFSLNQGSHDNTYWEAHLIEYLRWYAAGWK
jgi:enterochelin esterase-like enzyme